MTASLTIGELADRTGVKVPTIRYYESIGVMPKPGRTVTNQRRYDDRAVDTLRFVRHGRDLGFDIQEIRDLLDLAAHPEKPCDQADTIATRHLAQLEQRIAILQSLRGELMRMIRKCCGGRVANCRVIEVLADHAHCRGDHRGSSAFGLPLSH